MKISPFINKSVYYKQAEVQASVKCHDQTIHIRD